MYYSESCLNVDLCIPKNQAINLTDNKEVILTKPISYVLTLIINFWTYVKNPNFNKQFTSKYGKD